RARANGARTWRRGFSAAAGEESWPSLAATETWSQEGLETVVVYAVPRTPPETWSQEGLETVVVYAVPRTPQPRPDDRSGNEGSFENVGRRKDPVGRRTN